MTSAKLMASSIPGNAPSNSVATCFPIDIMSETNLLTSCLHISELLSKGLKFQTKEYFYSKPILQASRDITT